MFDGSTFSGQSVRDIFINFELILKRLRLASVNDKNLVMLTHQLLNRIS